MLSRSAAAAPSGNVLAPDLVDQPVSSNNLVGVQGEHSDQRTRFAAAERKLAAVAAHLERPQDPELHLPVLPEPATVHLLRG